MTNPGHGLPAAAGDGVTDDGPAIRGVMKYCQANGGNYVVHFPSAGARARTYRVDRAVSTFAIFDVPPIRITFLGDGIDTVLFQYDVSQGHGGRWEFNECAVNVSCSQPDSYAFYPRDAANEYFCLKINDGGTGSMNAPWFIKIADGVSGNSKLVLGTTISKAANANSYWG